MQIPFGLGPDGRLVEVREVERGAACNCRCPGCGAPLMAKKGEVNVQHFSHLAGAECATGVETALHMAAKQLIAEKRWLRLPELEVFVSRSDPACGLFTARKAFRSPAEWHFDRVDLELSIGAIRPDALGYIGESRAAVEIRVTHAVDSDKDAYLASLELPCVEVNLAPLVGKVFTFDDLERAVIKSLDNKEWRFHPRKAEWEALLLAGFDAWRTKRLAELAAIAARAARTAKPASPVQPVKDTKEAFRLANEKYRGLPQHEKWLLLEQRLGVPRAKFPSHLRVTLREGGDVVMADKELWQGALFAQFILGAPDATKISKRMPYESSLCIWLAQRFGVKGANEDAARPAVRSYMNYLRACGFVQSRGGALYVAHDQLTTPQKEPTRTAHPPKVLARALHPAVAPVQHAHVAASSSAIKWSESWPDVDRLHKWAAEMSEQGEGFDWQYFSTWLMSLKAPASLDDAREAFEDAWGNPAELEGVLRGVGVVTNTWRYFSYGEPAPWVVLSN
jgi:hypothetical protein